MQDIQTATQTAEWKGEKRSTLRRFWELPTQTNDELSAGFLLDIRPKIELNAQVDPLGGATPNKKTEQAIATPN